MESINTFPPWSPRIWSGMRLGRWMQLLRCNWQRIDPHRMGVALIITGLPAINSMLSRMQNALYGRQIDRTAITEAPIFIIGHWRSGTTFLHEMIVSDKRFAFPSNYACFAPSHFLLSHRFIPMLLAFLLPKKRPKDNMRVGLNRPQEDEFALVNLGCSSPYLRMLFPNELPSHCPKFLSHFCFNRALWAALDASQGLQIPDNHNLEAYIFTCFELMYRDFETQLKSVDPKRICHVRYEDIVAEPLELLEQFYNSLEIGDFETIRPAMQNILEDFQNYRPNRYAELNNEVQEDVKRRWKRYAEIFGYTL